MDFYLFDRKSNLKECINLFIKLYYNDKLCCPFCQGSTKISPKLHFSLFECAACLSSFSIFNNTIFFKSHTNFKKWLYSFYLLTNNKKHITATYNASQIKVSQKTSGRMLNLLKKEIRTNNIKLTSALLEINDRILNDRMVSP